MKNKKDMAKEIIELVGGESNINSLIHCATRLRFTLKDRTNVKKSELSKLPGVLTVVETAGQFQVVVGNIVGEVYKEIMEQTSLGDGAGSDNSGSKGSILERAIDVVSSIFSPIIGVLAGAGIIKGILLILTQTELLQKTTGTYQILNAASDSVFYFLPVVLAITASKKFGTNQMVSVIIGLSLLYPGLVTFMASGEHLTFLSIPVLSGTYASTVIPSIIAIWVLSYLERFLIRIIPDVLKLLLVPAISLSVIVPLTLLIFGPFGIYVGNVVSSGYNYMYEVSPLIAGLFVGGGWTILVMFGLHKVLVPIGLNDIATLGYTTIFAFAAPANLAQSGAALGVALKLKNKKMKSVATSASLAASLGITEPAIYGFNLKYKAPMIIAVISGSIGGIIVGIAGSKAYAAAVPGLMTLPIFFGPGFIGIIISIVTAFVVAFVVTLLWKFKMEDDIPEEILGNSVEATTSTFQEVIIDAPLSGTVMPLTEVNDEAFASEALGKGTAITPSIGSVYAPCDGEIVSVHSGGHAIGIRNKEGVELLIHIGIGTVKLKGKYFTVHIKEGDIIKHGDLIVQCELEKIKAEGFDTTTMLIVTNGFNYSTIDVISHGEVQANDALLKISNEKLEDV
ncbi:beta-glucoside-specific PTS transporter subunit IIABC [Paenibacillus sp. FSL R5-0519]|uniref:beta-glucoside-specific PTS transporter subunit IIABC n=1 Tax=Paenibacillus sp. FSL R5-0519 TaxID=2921648 RepID=UPI0030D87F16